MQLGAYPQRAEDGDRHEQHQDTGGKANIKVAVGIVHIMAQDGVPDEQCEDGETCGCKEGEEGGCHGEQQALKQAEAFQGETEEGAAGMPRLG